MQKFRAVHFPLSLTLLWCAGVLLNAGLWLFLVHSVQPKQDVINLHYNIYFGIDLLGPWWYLFLLPAAGALVVVVNMILSMVVLQRHRLTAVFFSVGGVLVQLLLYLILHFVTTQI